MGGGGGGGLVKLSSRPADTTQAFAVRQYVGMQAQVSQKNEMMSSTWVLLTSRHPSPHVVFQQVVKAEDEAPKHWETEKKA